MYNPETGQRLTTPDGASQVWLELLTVDRPSSPPPMAALGMQHAKGAQFGALSLLGYDLYKLGFAHQPETLLRPGDVLHVNLYWQAETRPGDDWQVRIDLVDTGERDWASLEADPVRGYPTSRWQAEDIWRGQFNLAVPWDAQPGRYLLRVRLIAPDGTLSEPFLSEPLRVEQ
jgi:hypothetical protein